MNKAKHFLTRWKTEYDFKTYISAAGSLAATLLFAFYNGFLGISHASIWHGTISAYYILLVLLRGSIISAAKKASKYNQQEAFRNKTFLKASLLLLILNISLIIPVTLMVKLQKPVNMTLIPSIAMAAYTTFKITMASVNLKRRKASSDSLVWLLRTIGFIDALVSVLTLQNTLIMVNTSGNKESMLPMTAVSSGIIWFTVLLLSLYAILKGCRLVKNK